MKILFIAPLPMPITGHSLASKVFHDGLLKNHDVDVVNLSKNSFISGINSFHRIIQIFIIFQGVWQKKKDADVIYFTISESFAGNIKDIFIYLICFKSLSKMVIHLHGGSIKKLIFDKIKILYLINKYFISRIGGVIILGQSHLDIFLEFIDKKKIYIVPNFAEDFLFTYDELIKEKFHNTIPLKILFLSNLIQGKGHNELVDAYQALSDELRKKVKIEFAGAFESDKHKDEFLKKIDGYENIHYSGIVNGAEKKHIFSNTHIFCLPTSLSEGQPISILEAYASGCVVITTNQGGIVDIFKDQINGFEVQKNSTVSIKSVIEQILENPTLLLPIAIHNRKTAYNKYRTSEYNASLIKIIEEVELRSNN